MEKHYYHLCANGAETKFFIICLDDYFAAFNLIAVCAANTEVIVISFSIEDTHPHILLYGKNEACSRFKAIYESLYRHYVAASRDSYDRFVFHCELYPIDDELYLKNVAVYTIVQPTKDGKPIMPYDYRWGSAPLYFRNYHHTLPWYFDEEGNIRQPERFGDQTVRTKRKLLHTRQYTIPDDWLVCNGYILPTNYIDVSLFEGIYKTHNTFRVFFASPRKKEEEMLSRMAEVRGVAIDDYDARKKCGDFCKSMFGTRDPRRLDGEQRILLAQRLRRECRMTIRQLSILVRLKETEVRCFVK